MSAAPTPGPWAVTEETIERDQFMEHPVITVEAEELLLADVYDTLDNEASTLEARMEQARANACLIAAALELLGMLKRLAEAAEPYRQLSRIAAEAALAVCKAEGTTDFADRLAAIAKAEGRQ